MAPPSPDFTSFNPGYDYDNEHTSAFSPRIAPEFCQKRSP
jgi:hypothetical protein